MPAGRGPTPGGTPGAGIDITIARRQALEGDRRVE